MTHNTYRPIETAPRRTDHVMLSKRAIQVERLTRYHGKRCGAPDRIIEDEVSNAKNCVLHGESVWRAYMAACAHLNDVADSTGWFTFGEMA